MDSNLLKHNPSTSRRQGANRAPTSRARLSLPLTLELTDSRYVKGRLVSSVEGVKSADLHARRAFSALAAVGGRTVRYAFSTILRPPSAIPFQSESRLSAPSARVVVEGLRGDLRLAEGLQGDLPRHFPRLACNLPRPSLRSVRPLPSELVKKGAPHTAGARLRLSFRGAPLVRGAPPGTFLLLLAVAAEGQSKVLVLALPNLSDPLQGPVNACQPVMGSNPLHRSRRSPLHHQDPFRIHRLHS